MRKFTKLECNWQDDWPSGQETEAKLKSPTRMCLCNFLADAKVTKCFLKDSKLSKPSVPTLRHVARFFLWGGAFGERSEPMRPKQLRSERSEQAVAGVWGRSPQRGPGAEPLGGG